MLIADQLDTDDGAQTESTIKVDATFGLALAAISSSELAGRLTGHSTELSSAQDAYRLAWPDHSNSMASTLATRSWR